MALLEITQLKKNYGTPDGNTHLVLDVPSFVMQQEEQVALCGESGSGKSTFLNIIAGILPADAGRVIFNGQNLGDLSEAARDRFRANHIGYIFQTFNLLQGYTCLENVMLGMSFGPGAQREHASEMLGRVGMQDRLHHYPRQLSIGQQQRVAVARALAHRPLLVLADEPTGNLDQTRAQEALQLIRQSCKENQAALLLVSHDPQILACFEQHHDLRKFNRAGLEVAS